MAWLRPTSGLRRRAHVRGSPSRTISDLDTRRLSSTILSMLTNESAAVSVRHALLALLSEGPKYGLQLRQEFEARTGEVWPLNVGQVYTTLQRLERDGLVESDDDAEDGPQKGFRLTAEGAGRAGRSGSARRPTSARRPATSWSSRSGGAADARRRRPRGDPGAPPLPGRAHAAMDPPEGGRSRVRPRLRPGRRRRAVPARLGRPVAGRRRRSDQAGRVRAAPARALPACRSCDGEWGCGHEHARTAEGLQGLRRGRRPRSRPCTTSTCRSIRARWWR